MSKLDDLRPTSGLEHSSSRFLLAEHVRELRIQSSIDPAVVEERGYESIGRPTPGDDRPRDRLRRLGIPSWAIKEDADFPGLLIPLYGPTGQRTSCQWKPRRPVAKDGKKLKYASPSGQVSRLDVHPRNRNAIVDPTIPLWITEGIKKADALTSRGLCVIALTGVFNWRGQHGTLADWEDVQLKGRDVTICFDADAHTNPNVKRAMIRLGKWLRGKGTKKVRYLIVPAEVNGTTVKGADDFLAAGGTIEQLQAAATTVAPIPDVKDDAFTDSKLAETIADDVLAERFIWCWGRGWLEWDGRRWRDCPQEAVGEAVRQYALERFEEEAAELRVDPSRGTAALNGWYLMLGAGKQNTVLGKAKGHGDVLRRITDLDRHADLLNTPSGVVDLETGELMPATPDLLVTKITGAEYRPDYVHEDWEQALEAVPKDSREWYQLRLGQAVTGHMTPDDLLVISQGGGENGKTTINQTAAKAIGDYFVLASDRLLLADPDHHPTELMDLQGARLVVAEETPEARRLSVTRLKRTIGTPQITARRIRQDSVTFDATHSLFLSTNYRPLVEEVDHGTWRRLALVRFPYRFRKPGEPMEGPNDRIGDPTLRDRCATNPDVLSAALAWLVDGARRWYEAGKVMPPLPERVDADTQEWRREADQVLGYLDERLMFDPDSHVIAQDLLTDVNEWLESRGHRKWSDKTLAARFGDHGEVTRRGVEKRRIRRDDTLSRPMDRWTVHRAPAPAMYTAWLGVRFRTYVDQDHVQGVQSESVTRNPLRREGYRNTMHTLHTAGQGVAGPTLDPLPDTDPGAVPYPSPPDQQPTEPARPSLTVVTDLWEEEYAHR